MNQILTAGTLILSFALAWCAPAIAQQGDVPAEQPAVGAGDDQPAVETVTAPPKKPEVGTTLVGERESPIGLYLTPWKNSYAEKDIDRPARLLQEDLLPIDEDVFVRNLEYYEALSGALKSKNAVTPPVPTP